MTTERTIGPYIIKKVVLNTKTRTLLEPRYPKFVNPSTKPRENQS